MALFDSGASYSIIRRDIAETLGDLARLPEAWEFEMAAAHQRIVATHAIRMDFGEEQVVYRKAAEKLRVV